MDRTLFDKVLFVGPDVNAHGGIASVLKMYSRHLPSFHYVPSNSRYGTLAGLFVLSVAFVLIPIHRLVFRRKILHVHAASGKSFIRKSWIIKWASLWGYKTIFHNHAGDFIDYSHKIGFGRVRSVLAKTVHTVGLAPVFVDFFSKELGQTNVSLIHNMIEPAQDVTERRMNGCLNVLFLGVISEAKGIFELVRAISEYQTKKCILNL